jgi:thioredoxin-dependent peroxiredoxin
MLKVLGEGDKAPAFSLARDGGGKISLKEFRGRALVVYFYPKDDTAGCTSEALGFTARRKDFEKAGAEVIGISKDSVAAHDKFKSKHKLGVILGSDPDGTACEAYGVWKEKNLYGRKYMGIERSTFLIGSDGRIAKAWRKVKVPGHAEAVLDALRALGRPE